MRSVSRVSEANAKERRPAARVTVAWAAQPGQLPVAENIATLPVLHRKVGEYEGQFRLPGGLAIPALACLVSLWLMSHAPLESWLLTVVFMGVGAIIYAVTRRAALNNM